MMATDAGATPNNRLVHLQALEARLVHKKAQLTYIKRMVRHAAEAGRIGISVQLQNAEKRADSALETMNEQLQQLRDADDDSWEELKFGIDIAWDDFSLSVAKIVARFS